MSLAYENDLTRANDEMTNIFSQRAEKLKALQAPGILEKAKALQKRGQDIAKSAQDVQSAIELGLGAPVGPVIDKMVIQPAIAKLRGTSIGQSIEKKVGDARDAVEEVKGKATGWLKQAGTEVRSQGQKAVDAATEEFNNMGNKVSGAVDSVKARVGEAKSNVEDFAESKGDDGTIERFAPPDEEGLPPQNFSRVTGKPRQYDEETGEGRFGELTGKEGEAGELKTVELPNIRSLDDLRKNDKLPDEADPTEAESKNIEDLMKGEGDPASTSTTVTQTSSSAGEGGGDAAVQSGSAEAETGETIADTTLEGAGEAVVDAAGATFGEAAAAAAGGPIGWLIGAGLAIGGIVEAVNSIGDTAAANQQQHLADAVHLPKSPPVNFAGKVVVAVNNAVAQE